MLLACNYSNELIELLNEGVVDVDYIKSGVYEQNENDLKKPFSMKPILLHGVGFQERASMKNIEDVNWEYINKLIEKYKSPHFALHLAAVLKDWDNNSRKEDITLHMINVVKIWRDNIKVPLLIENMPYSSEYGMMKLCTYTEVISEVLERTNVKLLLDIAHAKITATNCQENIYDYLDRLPLAQVEEVHVVGTSNNIDVELRDSHLEMNEEDFEILMWILSKTKPSIITLEYGGLGEAYSWRSNKEELKRQLIKLSGICKRHS